jgi:uncharacterized protein YndB with AHSA1/START domain
MSKPGRTDLSVTRRINRLPERVYDAWLDPKKAKKFLFATAGGQMLRAETDPRVGGKFMFVERRDGDDFEHSGTYLELFRPQRIVFEFAVPKVSAEKTMIEVEITPNGTGSDVTLIHRNATKEHEDKARNGWTTILNNLADSLG